MRSDGGETEAVIGKQISEAEAYLESMESRGFYKGGPPAIDGVYDSRVFLLKESLKFLLGIARSSSSDCSHVAVQKPKTAMGAGCEHGAPCCRQCRELRR